MKPLLPVACALLLAACAEPGPATVAESAEPTGQPASAAAGTAPGPGPCDPAEETVFACSPGAGHAVALCGTADGGSLQYRETRDGTSAEPAWPADDVPASQAFLSGTLMFSGGGGAFLRFDREDQVHTVYTGIGRGWEKAGVLVQKDGRTVRELTCEGEVTSTIGPELFDRAGIPDDPSGFEIP